MGIEETSYSGIVGKQVDVIESVTSESGLVEFSGCHWSARLDRDSTQELIGKGSLATIKTVKGNVLYIS